MVSLDHHSIKAGDMRMQNMKMAVDLSGIKTNTVFYR